MNGTDALRSRTGMRPTSRSSAASPSSPSSAAGTRTCASSPWKTRGSSSFTPRRRSCPSPATAPCAGCGSCPYAPRSSASSSRWSRAACIHRSRTVACCREPTHPLRRHRGGDRRDRQCRPALRAAVLSDRDAIEAAVEGAIGIVRFPDGNMQCGVSSIGSTS